jgi:hypothetical protein
MSQIADIILQWAISSVFQKVSQNLLSRHLSVVYLEHLSIYQIMISVCFLGPVCGLSLFAAERRRRSPFAAAPPYIGLYMALYRCTSMRLSASAYAYIHNSLLHLFFFWFFFEWPHPLTWEVVHHSHVAVPPSKKEKGHKKKDLV